MSNLGNIDSSLTPYLLLGFHCIIGGIAAKIAVKKGYNGNRWVILGLIGGTASLVSAIWIKPKN